MQLTLVAYLLPHLFTPWSDLCQKQFDKENYLEHPIPEAPVAPPGQQVPHAAVAAYAAWVKGQKEVFVNHGPRHPTDLAHLGAYDML
ncbi:hypothetical protein Tco_1290923 [Tanacetum coccineum]